MAALLLALLMELTGQALSGAMLANLHADAQPAPPRTAFAGAMPCTCRGLLGGLHRSSRIAFVRARACVGAGARRHQTWCTSPSMQLDEEPQDGSEEDRARFDEERAKLDRLFKLGAAPEPESLSGSAASPLADGGPSAGTPLLRGPRDSAAAEEPKAGLRPDEAAAPSTPGDIAAPGASARAADGAQGVDQSSSHAVRSPGAARPPRHRCKRPNIDCECGDPCARALHHFSTTCRPLPRPRARSLSHWAGQVKVLTVVTVACLALGK